MFAIVVPLARDKDRIIEVFFHFVHWVPYVCIEETLLQPCTMNDLELIPTQTTESSQRIPSFFFSHLKGDPHAICCISPSNSFYRRLILVSFFLCVISRPKTLLKTSSCKKMRKNSFGGIKKKINLFSFCQKVAFWYKKNSRPDTNKGASTNKPYISADTCPTTFVYGNKLCLLVQFQP